MLPGVTAFPCHHLCAERWRMSGSSFRFQHKGVKDTGPQQTSDGIHGEQRIERLQDHHDGHSDTKCSDRPVAAPDAQILTFRCNQHIEGREQEQDDLHRQDDISQIFGMIYTVFIKSEHDRYEKVQDQRTADKGKKHPTDGI